MKSMYNGRQHGGFTAEYLVLIAVVVLLMAPTLENLQTQLEGLTTAIRDEINATANNTDELEL